MNVEKLKALMPLLELAEALGAHEVETALLKKITTEKSPARCDEKTYIKLMIEKYG
mgnify:CR=1 FL=1